MLFAFEIVIYGHKLLVTTFCFYLVQGVLIVEVVFVIFQCNISIVRLILFEINNNTVLRIAAKHIATHVCLG